MTSKFMTIALVLILGLWIAPLVLALGAGGLASILGCELNEGAAHPCVLLGSDIGGTLYTFGVLGWLTLIGIPFAIAALVVWAIVAAIVSRRNRAR
jgi:hypothetical protein